MSAVMTADPRTTPLPRLAGKVAIVTGATQGIGAATARLFAAHGAKVVLNVLEDNAQARETLASLNTDDAMLFQADITDGEAITRMVAAATERFGAPDVLINNAGINVFNEPLSLTDDEWARCFEVDLKGAWNCARAVLPGMLSLGRGSIVNIASVHGHKIIPHCFPYPVAKHGLIGLTKALGIEYAPHNIRVNSISPGLVLTAIAEAGFAAAADPVAERRKQTDILPNKRIGEPLEIAYTALFLASDEARYINAADIRIDGGRSQLYHE
ncbi:MULTISPECIES: SDR family oxidoreductase [Luteibacter]|uniref:SDR family oxidoreductase n=1 Tax=Luteibacter TaxID=242605 RepID=UPI001EFB3D38|nr:MULTISPECIES: SDR family oxidoreductase [unclassified Luteibacter]MDR6643765.1 NAD(P)-dependent dehydrogenase (short-subunit alcohol dehydrogenase family) [Luteibacter sp. 1214]